MDELYHIGSEFYPQYASLQLIPGCQKYVDDKCRYGYKYGYTAPVAVIGKRDQHPAVDQRQGND